MKRFLLADDHNIVRTGIKNLIRENYLNAVIDEAADGYEIAERFKSNRYDLAVLDVNMPDTDFMNLIPWLANTDPGCYILVFTTYTAGTYGVRSMLAGAHGFLNKSATNDDILRAIQTLLSGKKFIPTELAEVMVSQLQGKSDTDTNPLDKLSAREMEIARLMGQGISLPEIGKQLHLGYSTVVTYKKRIFMKLQIDNVLSLARVLQLNGLDD